MLTKEIDALQKDGLFYAYLKNKNKYEDKYLYCMEITVYKLLKQQTSANKPGMLLGKIQSGKTRTFLGIMGLAYDNGYDVVIILTKGTRALVKQTVSRVELEFKEMVQNEHMRVYDIMHLPDNLSKWELNHKLAIVVKKETRNMDRIRKALFETYPTLKEKNILFIDDEADFASVSFYSDNKKNIIDMNVIASKIDHIRSELKMSSFLQVTATPYSLYLQPDDTSKNGHLKFEPIRPAFTELVPIHDKYVGGEVYFEESKDPTSPAYYLYQELDENDLIVLKKPDLRRVRKENILLQKNLNNINSAIINFIVGGCIRRWQQKKLNQKQEKYSMVVHTERNKKSHDWQESVIRAIVEELIEALESNEKLFSDLIYESYKNLLKSVKLINVPIPEFEKLLIEVKEALQQEMLIVNRVNSDKEVEELLDDSGQLNLRTPLNIFIGGQILDRGVTISNLIGFFYGRNPKSFQQDTVLQHSRMYGARSREDIAVTRFYTTRRIYNVMERIHEFDTELRKAFEKGGHSQGVVFIQKDVSNRISPCSPNKILLSKVVTLRPHKRILPVGFQTIAKTYLKRKTEKITRQLENLRNNSPDTYKGDAFLVHVDRIKDILTQIHETFEMEKGYEWDLDEYYSILDYLTLEQKEKMVWVIVREDRNINRIDSERRFENSPDTPKGEKGELTVARQVAIDHPAIMFLKQNGKEEDGWRGAPFYWPVLLTQKNINPTVYAKDTIK
ncbi:MAG: hypothetical protein H0Z32_15615 [Bacillaceae bacterium]|nr:hypothetical protein [Bacillaceae bacterium]